MASRGTGRPRGGGGRSGRKGEEEKKRMRLIPRKRQPAESRPEGLFRKRAKKDDDEEILSDDADGPAFSEEDEKVGSRDAGEIDSDTQEDIQGELPDERRLRVAREYLNRLARSGKARRDEEDEDEEEEEEEDEEEEEVAKLLQKEAASRSASTFNSVASLLSLSASPTAFLRGHKLPLTCVAAPGVGDASERTPEAGVGSSPSPLDRHVYTGGKDCCVILWDLQEEKKIVFEGQRNNVHAGGHFRPVLDVCVAPDESFFCSVGEDELVRIWDARASTRKCVATLRGHTGPIRSVKFNSFPSSASATMARGERSAFSSAGDIEIVTCSADKSVKLWNLNLRACLNSFYGHTAPVSRLDIIQPNKPLTVGEDNCARSWKLIQDSHLVFSPQLSALESCALLTPSLFACGSASGVVSLYATTLKRPLGAQFARQRAGKMETGDKAEAACGKDAGVTAMAAMRRTDVFFSGTEDGQIQMWKVKAKRTGNKREDEESESNAASSKALSLLSVSCGAPTGGVVADLTLSPSYGLLVAGVSKESRLGRWVVNKSARNGIAIYKLQQR
ncbi:WD-40 repeat protein, related [Neospora caninum Liverpool]|uniref:WD-40 repeat protein, related n=1 Tax=Neospora caninum (strain Liverpool) TaxID=572307 RepID=F0VFM0_NEOCL|nr:WD-40 repeat protein, related [Neospora caninum Liverpool]CBZ52514.1 WD-40 repeat protein, related [Neospora caninum Liverpool]CEL66491.1 TPA: WD-40 repeat protein, related [Neospora caninum Liverpool]|eukprot:XP_003882546.1 WD-40 repeat protein, related [Neospora caninum Liverpool]